MTVTKKVVFVAKDGCIDELKTLLGTMIQASRVEDGCLLYNIYQMKEKPNTFVVVEAWENEEALEGHKKSEHYLLYKSKYEQFTADKYSDNLISLG